MAPRPTAKQATEFLKIYQVRRENAAIYQELQSLRGEVSDLHNANDEVFREFDSMKELSSKTNALVTRHEENSKDCRNNIEILVRDTKMLQSTLGTLRARQDKQTNDFSTLRDHLVDKVHMLETRTKDTEREHQSNHDMFAEDPDGLRQLMNQDVRTSASVPQSNGESIESVSRVYDSVVGNDDHIASISVTKTPNQIETVHHHRPAMIENVGVVARNLPVLQYPDRPQKATVPEDLDLDDIAQNISYAGHNLNPTFVNDSFVMLPYQESKVAEYVDGILALTRNPDEALGDFLKRGFEIMGKVPNASGSVVIHKIVEGLTDADQQNTWTRWLNATAWTKDNLSDVACLYGVNKSDIIAERPVNMSHISTIPGTLPLADVIVPATANSHSQRSSITEEASNTQVEATKIQPRRSQRLGTRLQVDHIVASNGVDEIVTETNSFDPHVPEPAPKCTKASEIKISAKKRKHGIRDTLGRFKKTTIGDNALGKLASQNKNNQGIRQRLAGISGLATGKSASRQSQPYTNPRTPIKKLSTKKPSIAQPQTKDHPSSPPVAKQTRVQGLDQCRKQAGVKSIALASPYNPKPRLISGLRKADVQLHQMASDSEVVLPRHDHSTGHNMQADWNESRGPQKKKRKLPLPPPPVIPILSTSTEEDSRFDTW